MLNMIEYIQCESCAIWRKKFNSLHKKYFKNKIKNKHNSEDSFYDGFNILFKNNNFEKHYQKIKKGSTINILKNIKNNYYYYYDKYNNINVNKIYKDVNNHNDDKSFINIKIIIEWYNLYDLYLKENDLDNNLSFENYVKYNKNKYKHIEQIYRFKNKVYKCYKFIYYINKEVHDYNNNYDTENLINFIVEKYKFNKKNKEIHLLSVLNKNKCITSPDFKKQTILRYAGNKYKVLKNHINTFNIYEKKIFIDLFSGSLASSLIVRNLNKNIEIVAFENNSYLFNFYEVLKNRPVELIKSIKNWIIKLDNIVNIEEKNKFINRSIIKFVNNEFNTYENILKASWFYVLNKISTNYIKYTKNCLIRIDIDKRRCINIKLNEEKILNFSSFLKSIKLINIESMEHILVENIMSNY